ncbi:TPA: YlbF family regulator [Staphylococcus aureus]|nr:YlbF family regulator [Staphylococcus aureus]HDH9595716.1 YlbF family regulator [Staphylococcus aureus]
MINEASLAILDDIDELADMIVASDIYASFEQAKQALENNDEAHLLYQSFLKSKEKYDEVMRFGKYHPDYKKVMIETGNPFFQTSHSGCATGGSCNCSL